MLAWAQARADAHYPNAHGQLALEVGSLCASLGPVERHIDDLDGEAAGKLIYGWVLRSDGHRLHTRDTADGWSLSVGDVYCIHPLVEHWTTCPDEDSELIFDVSIKLPHEDPPEKVAALLKQGLIMSIGEHECARKKAAADERFSYRSIQRFE